MNLQDKIAAIKTDCEERLPDLPRFGGEARARRAVLAAIKEQEWCFGPVSPGWKSILTAREALQAISDAWDGRAE